MTTVVISQPMYFPWVGFFEQMALADIYVWLDDAQFSKGSFTNRIQVKIGNQRKWMSIPLAGKGSFTPICDLKSSGNDWRRSHKALLEASLARRTRLSDALELYVRAIEISPLCDFLIASAEIPAAAMDVLPAHIVRSSDMPTSGHSSQRVLDIVRKLGGTRYLTGHGAANYLDHEEFEKAGIEVDYMDYRPLPWPQPDGEFTPYVTVLDLIASVGASEARHHLRGASMPWRRFVEQRLDKTGVRGNDGT
ncbi:WbqC family protein [Stappia sp. F7233]|uniref:WbqC family protein n=1 Tax=Stappia albiluteola TaxID=2758565 RepID=A0A839AFA6_9HYPH|nr:WbqC family protein [Stappia albiluteola]MBA5778530.1 WbqC family protein [Stappia albiluteola]